MKKEIVKLLKKEHKEKSLVRISEESGIPYATLWRVRHKETGNINTWDKLAKHFKVA